MDRPSLRVSCGQLDLHLRVLSVEEEWNRLLSLVRPFGPRERQPLAWVIDLYLKVLEDVVAEDAIHRHKAHVCWYTLDSDSDGLVAQCKPTEAHLRESTAHPACGARHTHERRCSWLKLDSELQRDGSAHHAE